MYDCTYLITSFLQIRHSKHACRYSVPHYPRPDTPSPYLIITTTYSSPIRHSYRSATHLIPTELLKGSLNIVFLGPCGQFLLIRYNDGHTGTLQTVAMQVGLGYQGTAAIHILNLLWRHILTLREGGVREVRRGWSEGGGKREE